MRNHLHEKQGRKHRHRKGNHNSRNRHGHENVHKKIVLIGNPNVGKSVIFNALTGMYIVVSNYPGTSVEITRGISHINDNRYEIIDTPGMYSLLPLTEEERIGRKVLLDEKPDLVLHVVDANNIDRMLSFTLQLIEAGLPVVLVCNMIDEAKKQGKEIDVEYLKRQLHIPVIPTIGTDGTGIDDLKETITNYSNLQNAPRTISQYDDKGESSIENASSEIASILKEVSPEMNFTLSLRAVSLLLLQGDSEIEDYIKHKNEDIFQRIKTCVEITRNNYKNPLDYHISITRMEEAKDIARHSFSPLPSKIRKIRDFLNRVTINPLTGIPILLFVLYVGLYLLVGVVGAGIIVDFLEGTVFEGYINPFFEKIFTFIIPWEVLRSLFVGDYGVLTLGLRYAIAIVLPIVTIFFFVFAILEDVGYLPRLAMLLDRIFKKIGLSGRAVIPMVLGLGCGTMATMVTRTLASKRERIIATILLALAIPCSAQLGVILGILEAYPLGLVIWLFVVIGVFLLVGFLAARFFPGKKPVFYMELPPLRLPKFSNVFAKTFTRIHWYLKEILPIFLIASGLIWLGKITRIFDALIYIMQFPLRLMGLPADAAQVFIFGFFRRDYGAAGLYDLHKAGELSGSELVIASIVLTLFLPCVAQFIMIIKERGIKMGIAIALFVIAFSFLTGMAVNGIFTALGVLL